MFNSDYPKISIITVNYNGKRFLKNLFRSISSLEYPKDKIQIIMIDNNSKDGSIDFIKNGFPGVKIIGLNRNKGYAGGNNAAFKVADGSYLALINNDCMADRLWLKQMVKTMMSCEKKEKKCGAISSKVLFFFSYLPLRFHINENNRKSPVKTRLNLSNIELVLKKSNYDYNDFLASFKFLEGFYPGIRGKNGEVDYWIFEDNALMAVPLPDIVQDFSLLFNVSGENFTGNLEINLEEKVIYNSGLFADQKNKNMEILIQKNFFADKKDLINSCGVEINKSFYSRDRGYLQFDSGQFSQTEEVFAPSGSSLLMNKKMLYDAGYFDEEFFTYYEDVDLFWRARLKGWKVFYDPAAVVRHYHCGTGREWSDSFTYHVIRNRLIMIFKCGWLDLVAKSYMSFIYSTLSGLYGFFSSLFRGRKQKNRDIFLRIKIFFELFYIYPVNLFKRVKIRSVRSVRSVDDQKIKIWLNDF
ncbi:MAG: glycosyltransferase family 2 protein [Actinobacteria bacterium]|nr:glycosyltransferase family 2 protein [Actinomycetota bacterium]